MKLIYVFLMPLLLSSTTAFAQDIPKSDYTGDQGIVGSYYRNQAKLKEDQSKPLQLNRGKVPAYALKQAYTKSHFIG